MKHRTITKIGEKHPKKSQLWTKASMELRFLFFASRMGMVFVPMIGDFTAGKIWR
jgi:hypothetical protein